jgi:hypothetical protein
MGVVFPEELDYRLKRRATPDFKVDVDLESIYSISYKSSNVDLVDWTMVNVPLMRSMDLHT